VRGPEVGAQDLDRVVDVGNVKDFVEDVLPDAEFGVPWPNKRLDFFVRSVPLLPETVVLVSSLLKFVSSQLCSLAC
jgi:hypothetical protein